MSNSEFSDSILYVDLDALVENYNFFDSKSGKAECGAVVKANAYGLGVIPVARKLFMAGCRKFFVANLDEAIELRDDALEKVDPECHSEIYVFHGIRQWQESAFLKHKLTPVINDYYQLKIWNKAAYGKEDKFPAVLHFDTGMNRLGFSVDEAKKIAKDKSLISGLDIKFIISHLSCPSESKNPANKEQLAKFREVIKSFPKVPVSFVNSSGSFLGKSYFFDIARPGAGLYGVNSTLRDKYESGEEISPEDNPIKNVISLKSKILQIREIDEGETVGYGGFFKVGRKSKIATIPVGYADGYLRSLANKSFVFIEGKKVPVVGLVSMDMITIDVTDVPDKNLREGAEVEIIGEHFNVDQLAIRAGTIGYEILTNLGERYRRVYIGEVV